LLNLKTLGTSTVSFAKAFSANNTGRRKPTFKAKARLAKREAMLKKVQEGADGQDAITQAIAAMTNPQEFHDIDKKDSEELVKPTTKKSPEAANTWPTVKGTYKESVTEKMISDRIAESENAWDFNRILREGILG
jgi:hypothetical protein